MLLKIDVTSNIVPIENREYRIPNDNLKQAGFDQCIESTSRIAKQNVRTKSET